MIDWIENNRGLTPQCKVRNRRYPPKFVFRWSAYVMLFTLGEHALRGFL